MTMHTFGKLLAWLLCAIAATNWCLAQSCNKKVFGAPEEQRIGCVCDADACDSLKFEWPQDDSTVVQVTSDQSGKRFEVSNFALTDDGNEPAQSSQPVSVNVDAGNQRQQIVGWGGAFTDSATMNMLSLPGQLNQRVFEDYFGPSGLAYNMGRLPLGGTDMSERAYSNDDLPPGETDPALAKWSWQPEDIDFKIPAVQRANAIRNQSNLGPLKLLATSWSMPGWMKSNGNLVQGYLKRQYYDTYAKYLIKFVHEYDKLGIPIWSLNVNNEPYTPIFAPSFYTFNCCRWTPREMISFSSHSLIPQMYKAGLLPDKMKLLFWDDQVFVPQIEDYLRAAHANKKVRDNTHGLAIHWYGHNVVGIPYAQTQPILKAVSGAGYMIFSTEASVHAPVSIGNWTQGEEYAQDVMVLLAAGGNGWVDWNLAMNTSGGPTWIDNRLNSAILVDHAQGVYIKNPMYYALGHFSRFLQPDSRVLDTQVVGMAPEAEHTQVYAATAELAQNNNSANQSNGKRNLSTVLLNRSDQTYDVRINLVNCASKTQIPLQLSANSIVSLAYTC